MICIPSILMRDGHAGFLIIERYFMFLNFLLTSSINCTRSSISLLLHHRVCKDSITGKISRPVRLFLSMISVDRFLYAPKLVTSLTSHSIERRNEPISVSSHDSQSHACIQRYIPVRSRWVTPSASALLGAGSASSGWNAKEVSLHSFSSCIMMLESFCHKGDKGNEM